MFLGGSDTVAVLVLGGEDTVVVDVLGGVDTVALVLGGEEVDELVLDKEDIDVIFVCSAEEEWIDVIESLEGLDEFDNTEMGVVSSILEGNGENFSFLIVIR